MAVFAVYLVWAMGVARERRGERQALERLRGNIASLRVASHDCVAAVELEQAAFQDYNRTVDSLRRQVQRLEGLDARGVPSARYEEYLEAVEAYNLAVPAWHARADSLAARREACEALVVQHNELADSLKTWADSRLGQEP